MGIAFMAVAANTFPIKDSFLKAQDNAVPALLAIAIYFAMQIIFGFAGLTAARHPARPNPFNGMTRLHFMRSLTLTCALSNFFFSLRYVPLANAVTLYTLQGLFCIGFGRLLLAERVLPRHLVLVAIASIGVMMVLRHEASGSSLALSLLPLLSGAFGGLFIILTRKLGDHQPAFQLVCQDGAVSSITVLLVFMSSLLVTDSYFGTGSVPPMPTDMLTIFWPTCHCCGNWDDFLAGDDQGRTTSTRRQAGTHQLSENRQRCSYWHLDFWRISGRHDNIRHRNYRRCLPDQFSYQ